MEPIPYFYESVNRHAIVLKPKQPFFDWLQAAEPDNKDPITSLDEQNVYLIREMEHNGKVRIWIKKHFEELFTNELNDWFIDENLWPKNRTYKMFTDWFDVEVHSMVLDLEEGPVEKDM